MPVRQGVAASAVTDLLFEESGVGRCLVAPDGSVLRANTEWLRSTGYRLDDVLGADIVELFPGTRDMAIAMHARARAGHRVEVPRHVQEVNGRVTWWEGSIAPVPMENGTGLLITAREVADEELRTGDRSQPGHPRRDTEILETISDAFVALDREWRYTYVNRRAAELLGRSVDELLGRSPWELFPFAASSEVYRELHRAMAEQAPVEFTTFWPELDRWFELRVFPSGQGLTIYWRDVTDLRRSRESLRAIAEAERRSTELLRAVANSVPDPVFVKDTESRWLFVNPALLEVVGKTADQVIGRSDREIYGDPEIGAALVETDRRIMESGQAVAVEERIQTPTGYQLFLSTKAPFRDEAGKVVGLVGVARNITERKRSEDALRESESRYRLLFQNMLGGYAYCRMVFDERGRPADFVYLEVNGAFERLTGIRDVAGKQATEVFPGIREAHPELLETYGRVARTGRPERMELQFHPLGMWLVISVYSPHPDHFVAVFDDVTAPRRAEQEREATVEFLRLVNDATGTDELVEAAATFFHHRSACEAVGIRLRDGEEYPYYEARGFSNEFVQRENDLCCRGVTGELARDGAPVLECMCGTVICGRVDPAKPFFTRGGSFWSNGTTELLATTRDVDGQGRIRNRCNAEGYESVALVPLFVGEERLGLLQLNDRRKGMFSREVIATWERLAGYLAVALARSRSVERLMEAQENLAVVTRLYAVLSRVNEAIVRTRDEQRLYEEICRIVADDGDFPLVWVGLVNDRKVAPVASAGLSADYLRDIRVEVDGELGQGPTGTCVREDRPVINYDFRTSPSAGPWRDAARSHGLRASAAFPLHRGREVIGALTFYAARPGAFTPDQVRLLEALCADISYALGAMEHERLRAEAERALREREQILREADRRKDEFLGMLSHELRNPLAPIRNSVYILNHVDPAGDQAERARSVIERQAAHLTRLVDDLLDVTRIARGKIELRLAQLDLRETVLRAADDFRVMMDERGLEFRTVLPPAKVLASADATRVTQVIGNLLHNAAKFTQRGDAVTLSLVPVDGAAEIRVRDTGAGIDAAVLPHVFDAFVQGQHTLARSEGGLGLGLSLVKGITELHGGTVRAESGGRGRGAEFVVRLPLPAQAAAQDRPRPAASKAGSDRRVLVVDDNRDAADTMAEIVEMLGHRAEVAYDGLSAIQKARETSPEVVLCDIGLPGMSGYEVAKALRALAGDRVLLVAVTGYAQPEDVRRAIESGFDRHLAKPPRAEDIERLLA
jgi:PAS domain S-box-containing protein